MLYEGFLYSLHFSVLVPWFYHYPHCFLIWFCTEEKNDY